MAQAAWTTRLLHQLADRIQNVMDKTVEDQTVKQIDSAISVAAIHPFDPFTSVDLHKMINDVAGEVGRSEKPRFNPPSEMAFLRSKHSQRAAQLTRSMVSMLAYSEPTDHEMDRAIELLFGRIDYNIRTLAPKISSARVEAAKFSTQLRDAVETSFADFLASAKTDGIEKNIVRRKQDPSFLSQLSLPPVRTCPAGEVADRQTGNEHVPPALQDPVTEPTVKRRKAESPEMFTPGLAVCQPTVDQPQDEQVSVDVLRGIIRLVSGNH